MEDAGNLVDPRALPPGGVTLAVDARLHGLAEESLASESRSGAESLDTEVRAELLARLRSGGATLPGLFESAPSVAVTRHLWRQLDAAWREGTSLRDTGLVVTLFALPVVIVTGIGRGTSELVHEGALREPEALAAILREHAALAGCRTIALADVLASQDALGLPRLGELFAMQNLPDAPAAIAPRSLAPSPLSYRVDREGVHLRFIVGGAIAQPGRDLFADAAVGSWGIPLAQALARELAQEGASALALPRALQRPLPALQSGRAAQREVGAQIFASNAIRKFRASIGEPSAVISAHRAPDAPGGGELRLSLSSPFAPSDAEGFRCPLYPTERVGDVATVLLDLLADCRVTDVRIAPGVHPDRDPATGLTLLFKPDTLPDPAAVH